MVENSPKTSQKTPSGCMGSTVKRGTNTDEDEDQLRPNGTGGKNVHGEMKLKKRGWRVAVG